LWSEFEQYAAGHDGRYPSNVMSLTSSDAGFARDLCGKTKSQYSYECSSSAEGYRVIATPRSESAGNITFTLTTGGVLNWDYLSEYMEDITYSLKEGEGAVKVER